MLVLSRKAGQSILIGHNIEVKIIEVQGRPDQNRDKCSKGHIHFEERAYGRGKKKRTVMLWWTVPACLWKS